MITETAQTAVEAEHVVDYRLPVYSEEELAEIEREDEEYFTPEKKAKLEEIFDRIDKALGRQNQAAV